MNDGKFEILFNILFNILFIRNYFLTDEDILWIICHEISHFILNHFNPDLNKKYSKDFRNLAFDCQVNSLLYNINERNEITLFKKINGINYYQYLNGEDSDSYVFLTIPPFKDVQTVKDDFERIQLDKEKADLIIEFWFKNYDENGLGVNKIFEYLERIISPDEYNNEEEMGEFDPAELPQSLIELSETLTTIREGQAAGKEYYENKFDLTECPLNKDKKQILKTAIIRAMFESQTTSNSGISQTC